MKSEKKTTTETQESQKSLGKLVNIMVVEELRKEKEIFPEAGLFGDENGEEESIKGALTEAEIVNRIIENYHLEQAELMEDRKEQKGKKQNSRQQAIRGQVRRALEVLSNMEEYLDVSRDGDSAPNLLKKHYGVEVLETEKRKKYYRLGHVNRPEHYRFEDKELRALMYITRGNPSISGEQAYNLIVKLWNHGTKAFQKEIKEQYIGADFRRENRDWENEFIHLDYVMDNVTLLLEVIQHNVQKKQNANQVVEFRFFAYDETLKLKSSETILGKEEKKRIATPLKVFQDQGRFYAFVATKNWNPKTQEEKPWIFLTYRVDLMVDLQKKTKKAGQEQVYIPTKEQKEELRWGNIKKYRNMSFSSEVKEITFLFPRERITRIVDDFGVNKRNVKIRRFTEEERKRGRAVVKYKDGDVQVEREVPVFYEEVTEKPKEKEQNGNQKKDTTERIEYVLCTLWCTEFGFIDWAMEYSEYATVLAPQTLVKKIQERVQRLVEKYS